MAVIEDGRYAYADPGSRITAVSIDGEYNLFGRYTLARTTDRTVFPRIHDEPGELEVVDNTGKMLFAGLFVSAIFAGLAIATVATGGAALAAFALAGAAMGAGAATIGMYQHDKETREMEEHVYHKELVADKSRKDFILSRVIQIPLHI